MPLLMAASTFGLGRRCWSSHQWGYLHRLRTICFRDNKIELIYQKYVIVGFFGFPTLCHREVVVLKLTQLPTLN